MDMIRLQIQILVFLLIGWLFGKKGWMSRQTASQLNFLVLNLILPCSIFNAFLTELNEDIVRSTFSLLILASLLQAGFWVVSKWIWNWIPDRKERINLEYGTVSNNAGTLGMVIGEAAFGEEGLLYTSIYAIPLRIVMWSYGVALYSSSAGLKGRKLLIRVLTHPCMIAVFLGAIAMAAHWHGIELPQTVVSIVSALGRCNTVLIMLVIGVILSEISWQHLFRVPEMMYTLVRLILLPAAVLGVFWLMVQAGLPLDPMVVKICVLESAMPAPVTMAMLSQKHGCGELFASRMIFLSTLASMITLPAWTFVLVNFF